MFSQLHIETDYLAVWDLQGKQNRVLEIGTIPENLECLVAILMDQFSWKGTKIQAKSLGLYFYAWGDYFKTFWHSYWWEETIYT